MNNRLVGSGVIFMICVNYSPSLEHYNTTQSVKQQQLQNTSLKGLFFCATM